MCAEWLHWCAVLYESHIYIFFVTCVSALRHHRETAMVSEASYAPMPHTQTRDERPSFVTIGEYARHLFSRLRQQYLLALSAADNEAW